MVTLIIVIGLFIIALSAMGMAQWVDGPDIIDKEEAEEVKRESEQLTFSSGKFVIVSEVEGDYSHIRI